MIESQKKNKAALKEAAVEIPGVTFRTLMDEQGDTATFFAFMLESAEQCQRVNSVLGQHKASAINFAQNSWHFYPKWEHLIGGATLADSGYPFKSRDGRRRVIYNPDLLPKSAELMNRTLVYPVPINMAQENLDRIRKGLAEAVKC